MKEKKKKKQKIGKGVNEDREERGSGGSEERRKHTENPKFNMGLHIHGQRIVLKL